MKMKMEMKNRSQRCNINTPRARYGHNKYSKCKKCLSMMMQHLNNI